MYIYIYSTNITILTACYSEHSLTFTGGTEETTVPTKGKAKYFRK